MGKSSIFSPSKLNFLRKLVQKRVLKKLIVKATINEKLDENKALKEKLTC